MTPSDIRASIRAGRVICKYADPIEDARIDLTEDEAISIARVDPSLIYVAPCYGESTYPTTGEM